MPRLTQDELDLAPQFESYNEFLDKLGIICEDPRRKIADEKDGICEPAKNQNAGAE